MSEYLVKGDTLTAIADAIRAKTGDTGKMTTAEMPGKIAAIQGGGAEDPKLTALVITREPAKGKYSVGDTFDPTGMIVTAVYNDVYTRIVTDYTISPDGALTEEDTEITISYTEAGVTKTVIQSISYETIIYGIDWDGSSTTKWTRTDAAADFANPAPYVAGATEYGSPFDQRYPWKGMARVKDDAAGELVAIPKFWYKITTDGTALSIRIADKYEPGYFVSPAHADRGDGKGERDIIYVGRYHCGSDYKSASGQTPKGNLTRAAARSGIHALGDTVWQYDFATLFTIWLLYLVEFADWNSQAIIGYGCGNNSGVEVVGASDAMPYHTGTMQESREAYGVGCQYRYIEGLWDNVFDWIDGCYNGSSGMYIVLDPNSFSDTTGGSLMGCPTSGYPLSLTINTISGIRVFYPSKAGGGANKCTCDNWGFNKSYPSVFAGGGYGQKDDRGLFCLGYYSNTGKDASVGSRLMVLPDPQTA